MLITDLISITELSQLTQKSRPTIYKYINEYGKGNYDDIPYSMINLFKMAETSTKSEIISYCNATYRTSYSANCDEELQELINLIVSNKEHLDVAKMKNIILEEINNDWYEMFDANKSFYEGKFEELLMVGKGKIIRKSGEIYEGDTLNGKPHEKGKLACSDGTVIVGTWTNGNKDYEYTDEDYENAGGDARFLNS